MLRLVVKRLYKHFFFWCLFQLTIKISFNLLLLLLLLLYNEQLRYRLEYVIFHRLALKNSYR